MADDPLAVLGAAAVDHGTLVAIVESLLDTVVTDVVGVRASEFPYAIPSITTAGRHTVTGTAVVDGHGHPFTFFVKQVQEWSRSPFFAEVPEELRELARASVPWRTEAEVYGSSLPTSLPDGLAMPRVAAIRELDESSYALWLEQVDVDPGVPAGGWDLPRYATAARLMGRFAACTGALEVAAVLTDSVTVRSYAEGRFKSQVLPILRSDIWQHPLLAPTFGELRDRTLAAATDVDAIATELMTMPHLAGHGDACPNNLLVRPGVDGFTLIDFGFFHRMPVGFDLGQLLVGDVQIGARDADDLAERDDLMLDAYREGLAAEGFDVDAAMLRRAHALQLALFSGLSALPFELVEQEPTPELRHLVAQRATLAGFSLDLLDQTSSRPG